MENKNNNSKPDFIAYHVKPGANESDKSFWTRIGVAWNHKDGKGLNIKLDLVPTGNGEISLRAYEENKN